MGLEIKQTVASQLYFALHYLLSLNELLAGGSVIISTTLIPYILCLFTYILFIDLRPCIKHCMLQPAPIILLYLLLLLTTATTQYIQLWPAPFQQIFCDFSSSLCLGFHPLNVFSFFPYVFKPYTHPLFFHPSLLKPVRTSGYYIILLLFLIGWYFIIYFIVLYVLPD